MRTTLILSLLLVNAPAWAADLDGFWCNVGPAELEAGIHSVTCPAGTVGLALTQNAEGLRPAGQELLCGSEIDPVFTNYHLRFEGSKLLNGGYEVGSFEGGRAAFTLSHELFETTSYELRLEGSDHLFYDEVTRDEEGWTLNRNRGEFRRMPVGTRTCAGGR